MDAVVSCQVVRLLVGCRHCTIVSKFHILIKETYALDFFAPDSASPFLRVAIDAARAAAEISARYYCSNLEIIRKEDRSPVTVADIACENEIKRIILDKFPEHGFYGEETGKSQADAEFLWLVDPIDGTKGFVRQYPFFSTQIALLHQGAIIAGVSSGSMMNEFACAERGAGAWLNGKPLRVSQIGSLADAAISTGNLKSLTDGAGWQALGRIIQATDRIRGYGDFYHYHLLAAGKIEAVIESDVNILDIAALSIIVEEAGGIFTDLDGRPPNLQTSSVLAANPSLHAELLDRLSNWRHQGSPG
jgi:histidinol-phosphatase